MATVNCYLAFEGTCETAFHFYKSVFGGEFSCVGYYRDMPPCPEQPIPEALKDKIMHISLPISKETVLSGADMMEELGCKPSPGDNISLSVCTHSEEEARAVFNGLSEGGSVTMPLDRTFWSPLFGMLTDKFGIQWLVSYEECK